MAEEVGTAFVSILPSLKGFSSKLKAELRGELATIDPVVGAAGSRAGKTFGSKMHSALAPAIDRIGRLLKTGLVVGSAAAVAGLGALTVFGLKSAAALEQTTIGIEALVGNAQDAKKFIGELQQFAAKTPFEFSGVADASRRILAFGTSVGIARAQVIPTLTTIGDLVSVLGGTQENIDSVIRAFGQMASKGKVSQEEVLQLAEALPGFNVNAAIASKLGLSVADTLKLITAGGVDARTGINAILEGMAKFQGAAGAMAKQSETLNGILSTFKDTIAIGLTNAFQPVIPDIKNALAELTPIIGQAIGVLAPALGEFISKLLPLIGSLVTGLAPILGIFTDLAGTLLVQLSPAMEAVGVVVQELLRALSPLAVVLGKFLNEAIIALLPAVEELVPIISEITPPLVELLIALLPLLPPLGELLAVFIKLQVPLFQLAARLTDLFVVKALVPNIEAFVIMFNKLFGAVKPVIDLITNISNWPRLFEGVRAVIGLELNLISQKFGAFVDTVKAIPGRIIDALSSLPGRMFAVGADIVRGIINGITSMISALVSRVKSTIDAIPFWAKKLLGITSPSKVFFEIGQNTIAGYVKGVESAMSAAGGSLGGIAGAATSPASRPGAAQTVTVSSSDPVINAVMAQIRDVVQAQFGGNVNFAFGTTS